MYFKMLEKSDSVNKGIAFLSFSLDSWEKVRSLVGLFYNVESNELIVNFLYREWKKKI